MLLLSYDVSETNIPLRAECNEKKPNAGIWLVNVTTSWKLYYKRHSPINLLCRGGVITSKFALQAASMSEVIL